MSFIQRELEKIEEAIRQTPNGDPKADSLRIAQQSLAWALEPDAMSSPSKYLNKFHGTELVPTDGTGIKFDGATSGQPAPAN